AIMGGSVALLLEPYVKSLLYEIRASDMEVLTLPALTIAFATLLAAVPAVIRAIRIDSVAMLRSE
ncbi:MAG TPA: hypothetical protein VG168_16305, partial [Bryobacteraceae bacterium]|nr:hypothetical protein [Bryobacteraceae bacterium]